MTISRIQSLSKLLRVELTPRTFSLTVIAFVASCLSCVAMLNFVADPYAQYAPDVFAPLVQTSRDEKVRLLAEMKPTPDGLIVGSSRVMKLEPDYLHECTGFTFLNAGMNHATPEDHLAIIRHYRCTTGRMPKMIVLGLDVNSFSDHIQADSRLLANAELMKHISSVVPIASRFQRWRELFSWQQTKMSLTSLRKSRSPSCDETHAESFRPDGLLVYHEREKQMADGTYDFGSALEYNKREYKQLLFGFDRLSKRRCELFATLANECKTSHCRLIVFITPMHPELRDYVCDSTNYEIRKHELDDFLQFRSTRDDFEFLDLSDIVGFAGDPRQFVDGVHPLEPNTRKMIQRLVPHPSIPDEYAVQ